MKKIIAIGLFMGLISCAPNAFAWDPEAEIKQQNETTGERNRLCSLAKKNPNFIGEENGYIYNRFYVGEGKVARSSSVLCEVVDLGRQVIDGDQIIMYKVTNNELVVYTKRINIRTGETTTRKKIYPSVSSRSFSQPTLKKEPSTSYGDYLKNLYGNKNKKSASPPPATAPSASTEVERRRSAFDALSNY